MLLVLLFIILRFRALRRRHLRERQEQEERRALEAQREARLAESRAVQEDMMRFRETLPPEEKLSFPTEKYRVTASNPSASEPTIDNSLTDLFSDDL